MTEVKEKQIAYVLKMLRCGKHICMRLSVVVPVLVRSALGGKGQKVGLEVFCQNRAGHMPGEDNIGL